MKIKTFVMVGLFLLVTGAAPAWSAGDAEFSSGIQRFKRADYQGALVHFVSAQQQGMDEPKLYYNMGVCQYKLALYSQAKHSFNQASGYKPMRPLAHYNLGLVALAMNDPDEADRWFRRVYDEAENEKLKSLAASRLGLNSPTGASTGNRLFGGASIEAGYDDNIQDPTLGSAANKGDNFLSLLLYGNALVQGTHRNGIRLGLNGYFMHYQDVTAYDIDLFQLYLDKSFVAASWENRARLGLDKIVLGGNDYLRTAKLSLQGRKQLTAIDALQLRYRYSDFTSLNTAYDKLEGTRQEAEAEWQRKLDDIRLRASYEYEYNDRNDLKTATTFTSYSPTRNTFEVRADYDLTPLWELDGRLSWRNSRYNDADVLSTGSSVTREDDRLQAGVKIKRKLSKSLKLKLDYKYTDNNSNISQHDYTRNLYSVGLSAVF